MREFAKFPIEDRLRQRAAELAFAMTLGLAFAWIGPFKTDQAELLPKLGYWVGLLACWSVLAAIAERSLAGFPAFAQMKPWRRRLVQACAAAAPMLPVTAPATTALTGFEATVAELAEMYAQIVVIGWGALLLMDAFLGAPEGPAQRVPGQLAPEAAVAPGPAAPAAEEASAPQACRLVERLPQNLRGPLVCLEMEDHYVRVRTTRGSALLLMRLGDAMAEAAPTPGAQAHRSWWVAAEAITRFERVGRVAQLHLKTGTKVPVSQRYIQTIEALAPANEAR